MVMLWLPSATRVPYGTDGGSWTDTTDPKGCLHTTESSSWPSYSGGAVAPHATVLPLPGKGVEVHQHTPFNVAARALANPAGGVQTNRDYVFQFELIGTSAKGGPGYYWPDADDAVLRDLYAKVIKPVSDAFGIKLVAPTFQAYPASYGARGGTNTVRMSGPQFDGYNGWLGHQHVPENDHGDPGAFPWARMMALVAAPTPAPAPPEDDMPYSPDEIEHYAGVGVHNQQLGGAVLADGKTPLTFAIAVDRTYNGVSVLTAQVAALSAAVKALADAQGKDGDAVIAAVKEGVADALKNIVVTVTTDGAQ